MRGCGGPAKRFRRLASTVLNGNNIMFLANLLQRELRGVLPYGLDLTVGERDGAEVRRAGGARAQLAVEAAVGGGRRHAQLARVGRDGQRRPPQQDAAGRAERLDVVLALQFGRDLGVAQADLGDAWHQVLGVCVWEDLGANPVQKENLCGIGVLAEPAVLGEGDTPPNIAGLRLSAGLWRGEKSNVIVKRRRDDIENDGLWRRCLVSVVHSASHGSCEVVEDVSLPEQLTSFFLQTSINNFVFTNNKISL